MPDTDHPIVVNRPGADLALWLRLAETPGVGPIAASRLLERFPDPATIFAASLDELETVLPARLARALLAPPADELLRLIDRTQAWREQPGHAVLTLADPAYPDALRQIADPPVLLYAVGDVALLAEPGLAMVGSRNASIGGQRIAQGFAQTLSACGLTIVSGLALGIDTAAHEGALQGLGSTAAVLGTGVDIVYPARNRALAHHIAAQGCLLSEYRLGTKAEANNFPRRNRIISGLARAVLVVEAAARSGSLITAHAAAEQGRDVMAIPGSIHAALSKGCHKLIKEGAKLVESADDVLLELHRPPAVPGAPQMFQHAGAHAGLLALLQGNSCDTHEIAVRTGYDAALVQTQLLSLELEGLVERLPGGMFRAVPPPP